MKHLVALGSLASCLGFYPAQGWAQSRNVTAEEARDIVAEYATCVVKHNHDKAANVLLLNADTDTIKRDFARLIQPRCVQSGVQSIGFDADQFRYALAGALVSAEFAGDGPSDFSDRPLLTHLPAPARSDLDAALAKAGSAKERDEALSGFRKAEAVAGLSRYGECVVRADPAGARLWVVSELDSREEESRIDALRPSFGACLKDGQVSFSKDTLRGTLALNYYRLAHAAAQASGAEVE